MEKSHFEKLVFEFINSLPSEYTTKLEGAVVVVEDEKKIGEDENGELFGLFEGIPMTDETYVYRTLPNKISIFYLPHQRAFGGDEDLLIRELKKTVLHELAHHFGIGEDRLFELGLS